DVEIPDPEKPGGFIIEKGKLLTLTNVEAERPGIALSRGTVADIGRLLEGEGAANAEIVRVEPSPAEKLARFLTSSAVSVVLLLGGLGGLYLEFKTPGFGFFGVTGLALLGLFFFGHYIAGLAGFEEVVVFGAGLVLLAVELFVTPGFGFMGAAGIGLILGGLIAAMARGPLIRPGSGLNLDYTDALETMGMAMAGVFILAAGASRLLVRRRSPLARRLVLDNRESGYKASAENAGIVPGLRGVTVTKLRPAGIALFRGKRLDVVSQGDALPAGEDVEVVKVSGNRVVVRKERKELSPAGEEERTR
nr:NfeD family protein [bacterium]